jgi:predicted chitinase
MVTKTEIKTFLPGAKADLVSAIVDNWSAAEAAGITTPRRIRQFMANIAVETAGLTKLAENLSYSTAARIYEVYKGPKSSPRFRSVAECKQYVKNPKALAIKVYGGRYGNGLAPSTDGWDFRGSGMLQTTFRDNFEAIGYADDPDALRDSPATAFLVAVKEWERRGCNALAEANRTADCRKAINGGTNGIDEVKAYLTQAARVWPDNAAVPKKPATPAKVLKENIYDGKAHDVVLSVQKRLDDLGYHEVGTVDGRWGSRTAGAITTFQGDNGLPLKPEIDQALMAALMAASPRVISPARAEATVADLREAGDDEIKQTDQGKAAGYATLGLGAFSGGTKLLDTVKDNSETARTIWDTLEPVQHFIVQNIWLFLGAGGIFFVWKSGLLQRIRLEKHQTGKDVSV